MHTGIIYKYEMHLHTNNIVQFYCLHDFFQDLSFELFKKLINYPMQKQFSKPSWFLVELIHAMTRAVSRSDRQVMELLTLDRDAPMVWFNSAISVSNQEPIKFESNCKTEANKLSK